LPAPFGIFPGLSALIVNTLAFVVLSLLFPGDEREKAARRDLLKLARQNPAKAAIPAPAERSSEGGDLFKSTG
jgi:hypothetical protein